MGWNGTLFDLNEPPTEDDEDNEGVPCILPQRAIPSTSTQPPNPSGSAGSNGTDMKMETQLDSSSTDVQPVEKEEGEWSDAEGSVDAFRSYNLQENLSSKDKNFSDKSYSDNRIARISNGSELKNFSDKSYSDNRIARISNGSELIVDNASRNAENGEIENSNIVSIEVDRVMNGRRSSGSRNLDDSCKEDVCLDKQEDTALAPRQKEIRGVEASHALKCANKRPKVDQQKEAMLGKKRSRQTMFLNLEDVPTMKSLTPKRQNFPVPATTRRVKEVRSSLTPAETGGEKQTQPLPRDVKHVDLPSVEGNSCLDECNNEMNSGPLSRPRRLNGSGDVAAEVQGLPVPKQRLWKQPNHPHVPGRKTAPMSQSSVESKLGTKKAPLKKQPAVSSQYQDTSVERLLREVTSEKFWHHPGPCIAEGILLLHLVDISTPESSLHGRLTLSS